MSDNVTNYGILINKDIKLHRSWFKQMTALHGINCKYRAPLKNKTYDIHGDLISGYAPFIFISISSGVTEKVLFINSDIFFFISSLILFTVS